MPSPLRPDEFTPAFDAAARRAGFRLENIGNVGRHALVAYTRRTPGPRPRVYLSAGIHGDEPAPPFALLTLLEAGFFDDRCTWFLCPLLNPTGFELGRRENFTGLDLNRDYKQPQSTEIRAHREWLQRQPGFDAAFCLHEDWEAQGFYVYELNPMNRPTLAHSILAGARTTCPIDPATVIDGREIAEAGIIRPIADPLQRETWPEAIYLRDGHTSLVYTTETPSALPLAQRVAAHDAVLRAAIATLLG